MIDIHCHLLPNLDDGPSTFGQAIEMAQMAAADGIRTVIATPHQLGSFRENSAARIRQRLDELRELLRSAKIDIEVYAGADVRIEPDLLDLLRAGEVLTLADRGKHVLLELPHELYFPLEPVIEQLRAIGMTGILSHPERNQGILADPLVLGPLLECGCLLQITAGSLLGSFGGASQKMCELLLQRRMVQFVATDAHGTDRRRPLLSAARQRVAQLTDAETADDLCGRFPARVVAGLDVPIVDERRLERRRRWFAFSR